MKANHDKCHLLLSTQDDARIQQVNMTVKNSSAKNILGTSVDNNFVFDRHVKHLCKKANRKLNAFVRLVNYMDLPKRRILMSTFLGYQYTILLFGCFVDVC